jgi:glycosyltransferase involved in cell wall biosynthesis
MTVGRASSVSLKTQNIEVKRGELVEMCAQEAGLAFKAAGTHAHEVSFYDMPDWYKTVDAVVIHSLVEGGGMPAMEAAAAGRLVISTPAGHFPLKAYQGGGILAPIESKKFKEFTVETLRYYKDNPAAYVEKCRIIQEAAKRFDWKYAVDDWIQLIESA